MNLKSQFLMVFRDLISWKKSTLEVLRWQDLQLKGALRHGEVAPLVKTSDYGPVVRELSNNDGKLTEEMMNHLAYEAFDSVCRYDVRIRKCIKDML